jgi:transposase
MTRLFTEQEVAALIEAAVAPLREKIAQLVAQLAALQAENDRLRTENARLKKNSSNSSKPPSSDIIKPPPPTGAGGKKRKKRRRGGQQGHPRHTRPLFPPEQIDHTRLYELPNLGPDWEPLDEFRVLQQVELVQKLFEVTEHRARCYQNQLSGDVIAAVWPAEVGKAGLVGPRLSALIGYQKGACHMSFTSIQNFFGDVLHLPISRGHLVKVVQKISASLCDGYEELRVLLPQQPIINIDETGHPENGKKLNTWGFHVPGPLGFTFFHIDPSHSAEVLQQFLGETFAGVVGCDYAAIYRKFLDETDAVMQFCWAHLIRDVKFLTTLPDKVTCRFGDKLLGQIKTLFRLWHRRETTTTRRWRREAARAQEGIFKVARRAPARSEAQNIAQRFRDYGRYYFTFLERPGVEPTNNRMEQKFRPLVIDRKITQGTRGEAGRRWCERIWTALATCAQRGRRAFAYLYEAIDAYFRGQMGPSLLARPP